MSSNGISPLTKNSNEIVVQSNAKHSSSVEEGYQVAFNIIRHISGSFLFIYGIKSFSEEKSIFSIGCLTTGFSMILYPVFKDRLLMISNLFTKSQTSNPVSIIQSKKSDPQTVEGACTILGISEQKITDQLIETQKTTILKDLQTTLEKMEKLSSSNTTQEIKHQDKTPMQSSIESMIHDVTQACNTLSSFLKKPKDQ